MFVFPSYRICLQLILGLVGGSVQRLASFYLVSSVLSGIVMAFSFLLGAWLASSTAISPAVLAAIAISTGSYFFASAMYGRLFELLSVFLQYLVCIPLFVNVFTVYSMANLHDISWGTKEGNTQGTQVASHEAKAAKATQRSEKARAKAEKLELDQHLAALQLQQAAATSLVASTQPATATSTGGEGRRASSLPPPLSLPASGPTTDPLTSVEGDSRSRRPSTVTGSGGGGGGGAIGGGSVGEVTGFKRSGSFSGGGGGSSRNSSSRTSRTSFTFRTLAQPIQEPVVLKRGLSGVQQQLYAQRMQDLKAQASRLKVGRAVSPLAVALRMSRNDGGSSRTALSPSCGDGTGSSVKGYDVNPAAVAYGAAPRLQSATLSPRLLTREGSASRGLGGGGGGLTSPSSSRDLTSVIPAAAGAAGHATMKFIAGDSAEAAYVPVYGNNRDVGLHMVMSDYADATKEMCHADGDLIRREKIARARRIQKAQEESEYSLLIWF